MSSYPAHPLDLLNLQRLREPSVLMPNSMSILLLPIISKANEIRILYRQDDSTEPKYKNSQ